jgi:hypothetical protein
MASFAKPVELAIHETMKPIIIILLFALWSGLPSCSVGKGCPSNGKNVGAERILSGDAQTMKAVKKAKKFKA